MIRIKNSRFVASVAVFALLSLLPLAKADIPGITFDDPIDLSLGTDAYALQWLQLNHSTHKLYTSGWPTTSGRNLGLKVIDTISGSVLTGIDLGRYTGDPNWFTPLGFAIDESAAPQGNKIYMVGQANVANARLRVIDGETDTNLTGEGTDLFLPVDFGNGSFESMAVNSANHKVYIVKYNGDVVVVDGPNRQVLTTLHPDAGNLIIANPAANKVFIVNHNGGAVIDSSNDTFTPLALPFYAFDAVLNPANNRIYFAGTGQTANYGVFAVDGNTGQLITSRTGLPETPKSITFVTTDNTVRMGTRILSTGGQWIYSIQAFDGTDLSPRGSLPQNAFKLAYDPMAASSLFLLRDYQIPEDLQNKVGVLDISTGALHGIATGYRPFEVAFNSRTNRAYVTDEQTSEILVIDGTTHAVVSRIPVLPTIAGGDVLLDPVKRHVAVSERLNRVYLPRATDNPLARWVLDVFDGGTNQFRGSILLDSYSDLVAIDDTRRRIYVVAAHQTGSMHYDMILTVFDADTEALITTVNLSPNFSPSSAGLAVNPVTGRVYASTGAGGVVIVDGNTNTRVGAVSAGGQIVVNRKTNKVYVINTNTGPDNSAKVINGATDLLETSFPVPSSNNDAVVGFDVDEITNRLYVAHGYGTAPTGRLTAYDANNNYQFIGQLDLNRKPIGITFDEATRQLFLSNNIDGFLSLFQDDTPAPADLFGNISTRTYVADGDNVLIGGFILGGSSPETKRVLIRAVGPSLMQAGVAGALPDTTLEVHPGTGNVTTNDNWKINDATGLSQQAEIEATGLPPGHDLESALVMTLPAGQSATAIVRGRDGASGVGLVEVYDLDHGSPAKLLNISTRGHVGTGDNVMIAGAIILGSKSAQVVVRAIGPSLAASGLPNPLEDPVLELRDLNGALIATNDDWQEHEAEVNATMLPPTDPRESVIVATLYPANYTAIARGKNGSTGVALVEAYYLSQ